MSLSIMARYAGMDGWMGVRIDLVRCRFVRWIMVRVGRASVELVRCLRGCRITWTMSLVMLTTMGPEIKQYGASRLTKGRVLGMADMASKRNPPDTPISSLRAYVVSRSDEECISVWPTADEIDLPGITASLRSSHPRRTSGIVKPWLLTTEEEGSDRRTEKQPRRKHQGPTR